MFEGYVATLISSLASRYIANVDISALRVSIFRGDVVLRDVELSLEGLRRLGLPIQARHHVAK